MATEDVYILEGKLVRKPRSGTSYGRTRKEMALKLATARIGKNGLFNRIGNVKLEEEKFTVPMKVNMSAIYGEGVFENDPQLKGLELTEEWKREFALDNAIIALEEHFGIGKGEVDEYPEGASDEIKTKFEVDKRTREDERKKRLREMERTGVIPPAYFTGFEEKEFDK